MKSQTPPDGDGDGEGDGGGRESASAKSGLERGRDPARQKRDALASLIWIATGLFSLGWFLVRVIPKPSRAGYPCQRAAFPVASSFVLWLVALLGARFYWRRARTLCQEHRWIMAGLFGVVAVLCATVVVIRFPENSVSAAPAPHGPLGTGMGIHPGRVVWVHAPEATVWSGYDSPTPWWEDQHTDSFVVETMTVEAIRSLAGEADDTAAWAAIFHYFNVKRGKGEVSYAPGEKIAIKINLTTCTTVDGSYNKPTTKSGDVHWSNTIDNSPIMLLAILRQLVNVVGVPPGDISVGDPTGLFANHLYEPIRAEFPDVVCFDNLGRVGSGRVRTEFSSVEFHWSSADAEGTVQDYVPVPFAEADYIINCAILKTHSTGVTLCAKNHYGSLLRTPAGQLRGVDANYFITHDILPGNGGVGGIGNYTPLVDLMGHEELGGKTLLYLVDGLFSGEGWESRPFQWRMPPFGTGSSSNWPSSVFVSQDPVAIDSVCYDFLLAERPDWVGGAAHPDGGSENYLHEAALAHAPVSGAFYDPEADGAAMGSLGVHEHWNNAIDKQYSRNLGLDQGIELVARSLVRPEIISPPLSRTNVVGSSLMLSATASGGEPLSYQWYRGDAGVPGANSRTLVLADVELTDAGSYVVTVSNTLGAVTSSPAQVTVAEAQMPGVLAGPVTHPGNGHTYYLLERSTWVEAQSAAMELFGELATINDVEEQTWILDAFGDWGGEERLLWIGLSDADPANNAIDPIARRSEFVWVNGEPLTYTQWEPGQPNNFGDRGEFYVRMNQPSHTAAGAWNDAIDTRGPTLPIHGVVELAVILPGEGLPVIVTHPISHTNRVGSSLLLSVLATNTGVLTYQWFHGVAEVAGAVSRTLALTSVQMSDAGSYTVVVSNPAGRTTSNAAAVSVVPAEAPGVLAGPIVNPANGHEYYLLGQSTWVEAETAARTLGGHLTTLRSQSEQDWVFSTFGNWNGQERCLWIGLSDTDPGSNATESALRQIEFVWASGELATYSNWSSNEPNNYREWGEFYVHMLQPSSSNAGRWNDTLDAALNQKPLHGVVEISPLVLIVHRPELGDDGSVFFRVTCGAGREYLVHASTDFADWDTVLTTNTASGGFVYREANPEAWTNRFYRVSVGAPLAGAP